MPNTPHPQEPLWVEASRSRLTNLHIDHEMTDAGKQRRPEMDLCRGSRNPVLINAVVVKSSSVSPGALWGTP